jgi:hypothetical protein
MLLASSNTRRLSSLSMNSVKKRSSSRMRVINKLRNKKNLKVLFNRLLSESWVKVLALSKTCSDKLLKLFHALKERKTTR